MAITPHDVTVWSFGEMKCIFRVALTDAGFRTYVVSVERPRPGGESRELDCP